MNTADYISSGILEQYALGDITLQEKKEVECMSHIYPEIKEALYNIQFAMENLAIANATPVDSQVKDKLFDNIKNDIANTNINTTTNIAKVVQPNFAISKVAVAASIMGFVAITTLFFYSNNNYKNKMANMQSHLDTMQQQQDKLTTTNKELQQNIILITSADSKNYNLIGNKKVTEKNIVLVYNKASGNVFITAVNFPVLQGNKQYQLWALNNGQPINLGVFDADTSMQKMKEIKTAQAFAVTIENKGGNATPNLEQLCGMVSI